ncbi:MAG: hypothetical protein EPN47_20160 [Acidobacteria bacterium]|nr:MAG: hypothetical protein EPN47_20160 [Acidobacteriota bacterium]
MKAWLRCVGMSIAILMLSGASRALIAGTLQSSDCLACHGQPGFADERGHNLRINQKEFASSVHSGLGCLACHSDITDFPHKLPVKKVLCSTCHSSEGADVGDSVHHAVMENPSSPACLKCHGDPHTIVSVHDSRSPVYALNLPRTCGTCHGNPELAKKYGLPNVYSLYIDSIHGFALTRDGLLVAATCTSCHGAHKILSPQNPQSRVYRKNVPATCGACHAGIERRYLQGAHGKALAAGASEAPVCSSCHTAHSIESVRTEAWQLKTTAKCGSCHASRAETYHDTFHGQVTALGFVDTARCWSCHDAHEILPASDPRSSIAPANLQKTCGTCHGAVTRSFTTYDPHANSRDREHYPVLYYVARFMNLLMLAVFSFFGLHTVLWFVRSMIERHKSGDKGEEAASG